MTVDVGMLIGVVMSAVLLYLIGHSFIDSFFARKEELLNRMYEKGEE